MTDPMYHMASGAALYVDYYAQATLNNCTLTHNRAAVRRPSHIAL